MNEVSLKQLIAKFQDETEETSSLEEAEVMERIKTSKYLVPVDITNTDNPSFALIMDSDENIYYTIFTDKE